MKITTKWLKKKNAYSNFVKWLSLQSDTNSIVIIRKLIDKKRFDWAIWLIVRVMSRTQCVYYAIYAAKQVLRIYEAKYPNDNRPRLAIEAAKKCLTSRNHRTYMASRNYYMDARNAARVAVGCSVWAAKASEYSARAAVGCSSMSARYAEYASIDASWAAADSSWTAGYSMMLKILEYGIKLLKKEEHK